MEYFVAVIDHGSITKAARALYVAQPSLSQAIRSLERQLGVELFDRVGRRLVLTQDGSAFVEPARRILNDIDRARDTVEDVRELRSGRLDIAALATLAVDPLPALAGAFQQRHPGTLLNVIDPGGSAGVVNQVRRGEVELGLTDLPLNSDYLRSSRLGSQEIVLVLPATSATELPDPVPLADVAGIPLVMEFSDTATRTLIDEVLQDAVHHVAVECGHRQAVWQLVSHGAGATFLPRSLAENELEGVVLRSTVPEIHREIGLVCRPGPLSPAAEAFCAVAGISPPAPRN
ncbi:LysR substrate-binding domain-containing protein [Parasphingorhabdus pacifica]